MRDEDKTPLERKILGFEPDAIAFDILFATGAAYAYFGRQEHRVLAVLGFAALLALTGVSIVLLGRRALDRAMRTWLVPTVAVVSVAGAALWAFALAAAGGTRTEAVALFALGIPTLGALHAIHAARRLRDAEASAREDALARRLDPHFLSNALNGIATLVDERSPRASAALEQLARLLEYVARTRGRLVPIEEELDAVQCFASLMMLRYESELAVEIDTRGVARAKIPPLVLLSLTENAVKHGLRADARPTRVNIRAHAEDDRDLVIEVRNPGTLIAEASDRVGHASVIERLALALPGRHTFSLREEDGTVLASLRLEGVCVR